MRKKKPTTILNITFILFCSALLFFLYLAPEETTPFLPHDSTHEPFHMIKSKKEAEKSCLSCHGDNFENALPDSHPSKNRCLFCHKREPIEN